MSGALRTPIRRLGAATVERIAAGEVVERPSSVVKELVENAYDAGATTVAVRLAGGGLERIEVADDGAGIPADELGLAVERHATSKLAPDGPVESIRTLGFRGEALAAIAAVARLRLLSRPAGSELAEGIELRGGAPQGRFAEPRAPGTTVEVDELFFNTPARRKFLRSAVREQVDVVRALGQLYLTHPTVSLRASSEGGELASLPATVDLAEAAAQVLGPGFPLRSFRVRAVSSAVAVEGVLGAPSEAASASTALFLSVNGRPVVSRPLAQAVRLGYGDTIPRTRFPVGVLRLSLPPERVDVNVHPTKREVRLAEPHEVETFVRHAVRQALASHGRAAEAPPAGPPPLAPLGRVPDPLTSAASVARQRTLEPAGAPAGPLDVPAGRGRPRLELLGAVGALYWVAASDDGIVVVDQHAASERLLYETLRAGGSLARQTLVEPVPLVLTAADRAALEANAEAIRATGFDLDAFGPGAYRVLAVPSYRGRTVGAEAVIELVRELAEGGRPTLPDGLAERRAASIACHAAIRAGDVVERSRIAELLVALERLPEPPRSCPHGRPIMVQLPRARLDRWFLRSGL